MIQTSHFVRDCLASSAHYVQSVWNSSRRFRTQSSLHDHLQAGELFIVYIYIENESKRFLHKLDEKHRSLLDLAVELRKYNFAEYLLSKGFQSSVDAETMFECIRNHDTRGATVLLSCGLPIDRFRSRDDGSNVLTCAVEYGTPQLVDLFLTHNVSVPEGILIEAIQARKGDSAVMEIVRLLIDKAHCDPNSVSMSAIPALHVAVFCSPLYALQLVELLVARGADINKRDGTEGGGYTALDIAGKKRRKLTYDFLESQHANHSLRYGAEVGSSTVINQYLLHSPLPPQSDISLALCVGAALGELESVKALVSSEAMNINEAIVRGDITPLHLAACRGHYSVCKFLVESGINVAARAHGGVDIHIFSSTITGSPLWFNPAQEGPGGSVVPPPIRLKTAAELAREAGHDRLAKLLDLSMVETVIAKREDSIDSFISWESSSPGSRNSSISSSGSPYRPGGWRSRTGSSEFSMHGFDHR